MTDLQYIESLKTDSAGMLTYQLEAAAELYPDSELVLKTLIGYMTHERTIVREGALLGLIILIENGNLSLRDKILEISKSDPSLIIREIANEYYETII